MAELDKMLVRRYLVRVDADAVHATLVPEAMKSVQNIKERRFRSRFD